MGFGGSRKSDEAGALPTQDCCLGLCQRLIITFSGCFLPREGKEARAPDPLSSLSSSSPSPPPLLDLPLPCPTTDLKLEVHSQADLPATTIQGHGTMPCQEPKVLSSPAGQTWRHPAPRCGRWGSAMCQQLTSVYKKLHSDGVRSSQPPCLATVRLLSPNLTEKETEAQEG